MQNLPHIMYVFSDEHCGFAMSHVGDPNVRTPNMDRLASQGLSFQNAYTNTPICTQARGTLFSGRHSHAGPIQNFFDCYKASSPSTATILRGAGYHTAYFGKWHMGVVRDQMSPAVRQNMAAYPEIDYFRRTPEYHRGGFQDWFAFELNDAPFNFSYYHQHEINPRQRAGYQTDVLTDMAIQYLKKYEREQPLFLVLSVEPPHFPLEAPEAFMRFEPSELKTRDNFADTPEMRRKLAVYYAMIENMDWNLGRLLEALEQDPRYNQNTLLVYFSDHGEFMGSHHLFERKEYPHEESVRIPAIFHWAARIPAQGPQDGLFSLVDLLPTTLDLIGLPIPAYVQGLSFAPACRGEPFSGPEQILLEMNCNPRWSLEFLDWRGLVTERWKYAFFETGQEMLFDLANDPFELENLAPTQREICQQLRGKLLELLAETREPYFDVLIEHGVEPEHPVINVSDRWQGGIAPSWKEMIHSPEEVQ